MRKITMLLPPIDYKRREALCDFCAQNKDVVHTTISILKDVDICKRCATKVLSVLNQKEN